MADHAAARRLNALAARQHGHFSTSDCAACGLTPRVLGRMVRTGQALHVHQGVYRFACTPDTRLGEIHAAVLAAGPGAVACRDTALELFGLSRGWPGADIRVCSPLPWRPEVPTIIVHVSRRLDPCDRTRVAGIAVTAGARTLVDLAGQLDRIALTRLVDDAVCAGMAPRRTLYRRATALRNGRKGVGLLVSLTHPQAAAEFRSWLERRASYAYDTHGVPQPRWNVSCSDKRGRIGTVDCVWEAGPVIVELEGLRFHTSPAQRRQDAGRYNRLSAKARLLRYTWQDIVERADEACAEILAALNATGVL